MRRNCITCAFKHGSQFLVIASEDSGWWLDINDPHAPLLVGHLAEIEAHLQGTERWAERVEGIREVRTMLSDALLGHSDNPEDTLEKTVSEVLKTASRLVRALLLELQEIESSGCSSAEGIADTGKIGNKNGGTAPEPATPTSCMQASVQHRVGAPRVV